MSMINLLPDEYIRRRYERRTNMLFAVLFACVITGVVGVTLLWEQGLGRTRQILAQVDADYEQGARVLVQLQGLQTQKQAMIAKATTTEGLQERVPRSYLLGLVTNSLPDGAAVLDLEVATRRVMKAVPAAPAAKKGGAATVQREGPPIVQMDIKGLAATDVEVARFIATLARNQLIESVDLVYSQEKMLQEVAVREFQVRADLKPNVDVMDLKKGAEAQPAPHELASVNGGGA